MKVLFSVGELEDKLGASAKLAVAIAEKLAAKGIETIVAGASINKSQISFKNNNLIFIQFKFSLRQRLRNLLLYLKNKALFEFEKYSYNRQKNFKTKASFLLLNPILGLSLLINAKNLNAYIPLGVNDYAKKIKKIANEREVQHIICLQEPSWATNAVLEKEKTIKSYIYQVDPYGLQTLSLPTSKEDRISWEILNFEQAQHIITTFELFEEYKNHNSYKKFISKMTPVDFPNLTDKSEFLSEKSIFDNSYINILYSGMIQEKYRSAEFFLRSITQLITDGMKVRCYFQGMISEAAVINYCKQFPNNIFMLDKVTPEKSYEAMNNANVLLNIGNTIHNMVPSKIFDYFSIGKPIINIEKIENCPARKYFEKYPLTLNLNEVKGYTAQEIKYFLESCKNNKLDFDEVEKVFASATPQYVADKFIKILTKDENNGK